MGVFAQHWQIAGFYRLFGRLKACATMVRDDGQAVAEASSRRSRITRQLNNGGICATMDKLNWNLEKL